jgi:molecular chaperone Hsp33
MENFMSDLRQRFFIEDSPVRGEVVHLEEALQTILKQRDYVPAVQVLLGEMLCATALLASTLKIKGRISLQIQASGTFKWAMAECNHLGEVRALADYEQDPRFLSAEDSSTVLKSLVSPVLFINIEPEFGERYQGIVPLDKGNLAECLMQYYDLSAQIPTRIVLASNAERAGGLLIQLLPRNSEEEQQRVDEDLWPRVTMLTETLKAEELTDLEVNEILYRLYNEEQVRLPEVEALRFGCTCSKERCANALIQIGVSAVRETLEYQNPITMDCQFCSTQYSFSAEEALGLFGEHLS